MADTSTIESVLRRDRLVVLGGLVTAAALAWIYLLLLPHGMPEMEGMSDMGGNSAALVQMRAWSPTDFVLMAAMWIVMMVAMMVPSATPMILLYAKVARNRAQHKAPLAPTALFVAGYLVIWALFSVGATTAQWALEQMALLSPVAIRVSPLLGGVLLIAAGLYQFTPLKRACLRGCRSPFQFLVHRWRPGPRGAFAMGLEHGALCLGCCWILMTLLFAGGVMSLLWVATIAIFVLAEKTVPFGEGIGRIAGLCLIATGVAVVAAFAA